jgi:2-amino-4-hydroxy-6-hydroxymethyldihydropteridine diphosphokinase
MTTAYIGLGSNEGDRLAYLSSAVEALSSVPDTHLERVSHAYESEPVGVHDQARFANAVARITTSLESWQLLEYLQQIEDGLGRVRAVENGPRTIDLDILLFGDEEISSEKLSIPHPRMLERQFVVVPLLEIDPAVRMPDGAPVSRQEATLGAIVGDLGPIADIGAAQNEPVLASDWVEVAVCDSDSDISSGWDAAISLQRQALQDAGIPYAFDPYEPEAVMDPWGMPRTFRILVPADYADQAKTIMAEVLSATPEFPEELESAAE